MSFIEAERYYEEQLPGLALAFERSASENCGEQSSHVAVLQSHRARGLRRLR